MKARDIKEVAVWMAVTVVLGIGILGAIVADSAGPALNSVPPGPTATIDGCTVTTNFQLTQDRTAAKVVVTVQNPTGVDKQIDVPMQLVSVDYSGSAMSRVASPNDYKETVVNTTTQRFVLGPLKSATRTVMMSTNIKPGNALKRNQPTYRLDMREGKIEALEGSVIIPASSGWLDR